MFEPSKPPNRTVFAPSQAIACRNRPGGPDAAACVQEDPFHSHVSGGYVEPPDEPPNRTVLDRVRSNASRWNARGPGPVAFDRVHAAPSHSQVSLARDEPVSPPNSTMRCRALS
ncbi:MAG: hypothetical protein ABR567_18870 [Myxococcales bacterium]